MNKTFHPRIFTIIRLKEFNRNLFKLPAQSSSPVTLIAGVLGTLGYIVLRGLMLSAKCKDPFGSLLLIGISSMIGIQVVITLGGATGLLPITGITLPFISYGGSSLLLLMVSIGIMENVIMRMNLLEQKEIVQTISDNKNM